MYKAIIGKTAHELSNWAMIYELIEPEFKTLKQKKRFTCFKIVSSLTRELVDNGGTWQPLGNIYVTKQ